MATVHQMVLVDLVGNRFLNLALVLLLFYSCEQESQINQSQNPCGDGKTQIQVGHDRPFVAIETNGDLMMEYGLQGGYHVDISLKILGGLNPDDVDVELLLYLGETQIGKHLSEGWYLLYGNPGEKACYFYNARVFLYNEKAEIPSRDDIERWMGKKARLKVALTHSNGYDQREEDFILNFDIP